MSRRIVFAGGTQTRALARIYRTEVAGETGDDVVFIGSGAAGSDAARSALFLADVIAIEIDEDGDALPTSDLPTTAEVVRIPNLYCDYLWPFAGRSHPKNRGAFIIPGGPYPAEHGDRYLDQMMTEGVDEKEAIRRYLALDIVREGELDSRLQDRGAIQQRLDGASGFEMADYIAENFRAWPVFRTRQRITLGALRRLVGQLLPKLGVRAFNTDRIQRVPFPAGAQPVHPGVAAHFGLKWVGPGQTYPVNQEGYFSFEAFCRRYMRFAWNEALHRGIETAKTNPADALSDLERGMSESPNSPLGRRAMALARHAVGLEPDAPPPTNLDEDSYDPVEDPLPPAPGAKVARADTKAAAPANTAGPTPAAAAEAPPEAAAPVAASEAADGEAAGAAPSGEDRAAATIGPPTDAAAVAEPAEESESAVVSEAPDAPEAPSSDRQAAVDDPLESLRTRIGVSSTPAPAAVVAPPQARPATPPAQAASFGTTHDGFTDFGPPAGREKVDTTALAAPGNELIDVLPRLLPVFTDLSGAAERPFSAMPEIMPPPPLRPILPPELQNDAPKQGLFSRILGRKSQ
jgi:hypothetical protein